MKDSVSVTIRIEDEIGFANTAGYEAEVSPRECWIDKLGYGISESLEDSVKPFGLAVLAKAVVHTVADFGHPDDAGAKPFQEAAKAYWKSLEEAGDAELS